MFIGINATTCEVAKNLILPGIGHITLLDDKKIAAHDVMSNFFLSSHMVGQSKTSAYEWLSELNPGVKEKVRTCIKHNICVRFLIDFLNPISTL